MGKRKKKNYSGIGLTLFFSLLIALGAYLMFYGLESTAYFSLGVAVIAWVISMLGFGPRFVREVD